MSPSAQHNPRGSEILLASLIKLIIYLLISFGERQKGIIPLYIYHVIFEPTLELLLFKYAMI